MILSAAAGTLLAQRGFNTDFVPDSRPLNGDPAEWVFARLAYNGGGGQYSRWRVDYPFAERHFIQSVQRLTRVHSHRTGHVVTLDSDDIFDYPWLYAVEAGSWGFSPSQAQRLREHLLRGGFLMVDDFHGEAEWQFFQKGIRQVFPDRPIEDIPVDDILYQVPYPIEERLQVPGPRYMFTGLTYERSDGQTPKWRGIRDDEGRIMVAISHNIDYGEGWEQADTPQYPEAFTRQAYEVGIDYLIYSMTQ